MVKYGGLLKGPGKGLSLLAFETSKKSRIMKKKMRISSLEKRLKEDLRDLGSLVYNDYEKGERAIFEDEDVISLIRNIEKNRKELDFLREVIVRISKAKKVFRKPGKAGSEMPEGEGSAGEGDQDKKRKNGPPAEKAKKK